MSKRPKAIIFGVSGHSLTDSEKQFFRYANPFGFILFQRNCGSPDQVIRLVADMREVTGRADVPILIDQEGGRVARLKPPHWPEFPPARMFGQLMEQQGADLAEEACKINGQLMAMELAEIGVNVNCAPLADTLFPETDNAIGNRAYSADSKVIVACARALAKGMMWGQVLPVVKHFPGHGRTRVDPHYKVSQVTASRSELEKDFAPFKELRDLPLGMTNHIVYSQLDAQMPCSMSAKLHDIIRNDIGFDGLLISDDLAMQGIIGRLEDKVRQVVQAGSDIALHCNGNMNEMAPASAEALPVSDAALERWEKAKRSLPAKPVFADKQELYDRLDMLLGVAEITTT